MNTRSDWSLVGPKSNDGCPCKRETWTQAPEGRRPCTDGDRGYGDMAAAKERPHSGRQEGSMGSHLDDTPLLLLAPQFG